MEHLKIKKTEKTNNKHAERERERERERLQLQKTNQIGANIKNQELNS